MKVKLFIDGANFYKAMQRHITDGRIDYDALARALVTYVSGSAFSGAHYYMGVYGNPEGLLSFLKGLEQRQGYFVNVENRAMRTITCKACNKEMTTTVEKGVDTRLSVDMVSFAAKHACDIVILLSGDEDFLPAIQAVNSFGVQTWVATWGNELSSTLRAACYGQINLRELAHDFEVIAK